MRRCAGPPNGIGKNMAEWIIAPLQKGHDRSAFSCGKTTLDNFIRSLATQYEKRHLARTYVATQGDGNEVAGYYSLCANQLETSALSDALKKKLPNHPIPTLLLGRLAVDSKYRGQGLGEYLLLNAIHKVLEISRKAGTFGIEVWAIDDDASAFYGKYAFDALVDHPRHMLLSVKTAETAWGGP